MTGFQYTCGGHPAAESERPKAVAAGASRRLEVAAALLIAVAISPSGLAQGLSIGGGSPAGSANFSAVSQEVTTGTERATSANYVAEHGVGEVTAGYFGTSTGFAAVGGLPALEYVPTGGAPLVFGMVPSVGDAFASTPVVVYGLNFAPPGAAQHTVIVGGTSVPITGSITNTSITISTPSGGIGTTNACQNPLGRTAITVVDSLGASSISSAFTFLPALTVESPPILGQVGVVRLQAVLPPQQTSVPFSLVIQSQAPGSCVHIGGFGGGLESLGFEFVVPIATMPGEISLAFPIPPNPALHGATFGLQAAVFTSLPPAAIGGQFTNVLTVTIP